MDDNEHSAHCSRTCNTRYFFSLPSRYAAQDYALLHQVSQSQHDRAEREQTEKDHRNHTGAKIVGGSAAGGAVVGALAGGGKGALIGGAVGAGGGASPTKSAKIKP